MFIRSKLMGGKFVDGFLSGAFGSFANPVGSTPSWEGFARAVVAGGVGSVLGGGKFKNGAVTAAFGYMFASAGTKRGGADVAGPEPTYAPELTQSELDEILEKMREDPKFVALEADAAKNAGGTIVYRIGVGVGNTSLDSTVIEIGRYVRGYAYTSSGLSSMSYDQDTIFFASDACGNVDGVQIPFTVRRAVVHELYHHVHGIFSSEGNVVRDTNKYIGGYRRTGRSGHQIDEKWF